MSLHHLDPRQAGVTEPDVAIVERSQTAKSFGYAPFVAVARDHNYEADTEAAALQAAREAAGFGHVAEQPCTSFKCRFHDPARCTAKYPVTPECLAYCLTCAWTEERHGKGER